MIQTWHIEIIVSTVNKVFVRHRTYLHVHFDIKQTRKFLYLIWYLRQFYALRVIPKQNREIICYLLLNALGCFIAYSMIARFYLKASRFLFRFGVDIFTKHLWKPQTNIIYN